MFLNRYLTIYLKGMMMGLADLVPGVSGGTIALITGIYTEFIETLNHLHPKLLKLWYQKGFSSFWQAVNGSFLICVFGGILTSVVLFSKLIQWLLANEQVLLFSFFFGVLLASLIVLRKQIPQWNRLHLLLLTSGSIIAYSSTQMVPSPTEINSAYLFFCGFIAISAMILPGLSGAYLLLILGAYGRILELVQETIRGISNFGWVDLLPTYGALLLFVAGIITGLLTFSRVLRWFLHNYPSQCMALLLGLMIGAIHKIWPWQAITETTLQGKTRTFYNAVWPSDYPDDPQWLSVILFVASGVGILFVLEHFKNRSSTP